MDPNTIVDQFKTKAIQATEHFEDELKKLRTGRAHPSMLDGVTVEAYGTPMPLIQVANVTAPEAQLLQITPFDPGNLQAIASAIRDNQALGLNPVDDGRVVRIQIPSLTEERRRELAKSISGKVEDTMVSIRGSRHEALHAAEQAKKDRAITEDDFVSIRKQLDDLVTKQKLDIDAHAKAKETEIMTV
ncbi:MAG: ribosome-recycling factor [Candidatus Saccharibacteria bacterium]|nr:ribosome-recycling factor [Candidatus Saccharibacteria bacterium]